MTAQGGGGRPSGGVPHPISAAGDRPDRKGPGQPRSLEQILALPDDANRGREMQATWRSFCRDRLEAVRGVLGTSRSPPEIAYQLGELLHNQFRTRGVMLTSYELRRLVAELLALHGPGDRASPALPAPVVAFEREPPQPWPGDVPAASEERQPTVPTEALKPPPSPIVTVLPRDRDETFVVNKPKASPPPVTTAESKPDEPGPIDRLWADRSVQAIFVNGPQSVFVEREGALQPATGVFRDEAHLLALATRLVGRPASGIADFHLRDGSHGVVVFPPAAPGGPVLTLRRATPADVTLGGLIAGGWIDRPVVELLRLALRSRLNMLVTGPTGSGKTALLAALVRDLDPAPRVVTVADHRQFDWPMASKVELVASATAPVAELIAAAARLEPALLVIDSVRLEDVAALSERLLRGAPGTVAAIGPAVMSPALGRSADLLVRIESDAGQFRVAAVEDAAGSAVFRRESGQLVRGQKAPAFAGIVEARGLAKELAKLLS